jgi:FMN phosphatase YigB (HAD superfamily)
MIAHATLRPGLPALAAWRQFDVLLVTNAHPETLRIKMGEVDITGWFDRVVVSHDLDAPKEQQLFWERLQDLHPFDPAHTLLIDDTESVLDAARRLRHRHLLTCSSRTARDRNASTRASPGIHHFDEIMPGTVRARNPCRESCASTNGCGPRAFSRPAASPRRPSRAARSSSTASV